MTFIVSILPPKGALCPSLNAEETQVEFGVKSAWDWPHRALGFWWLFSSPPLPHTQGRNGRWRWQEGDTSSLRAAWVYVAGMHRIPHEIPKGQS